MKAFTLDKDGLHEHEAPADMVAEVEAVEAAEGAKAQLDARLKRLREQRGEIIIPVKIDNENWYLKKLDFAGVMLAGLLLGRDAESRIQMGDMNVMRALLVTALHCGVATSATDKTELFSLADAEAWADEPGALETVSALFAKLIEINPILMPVKNSPGATSSGSPSSPAKKRRTSRKN